MWQVKDPALDTRHTAWYVDNDVLVHCNEEAKQFYAVTSTIDKQDRTEVFGLRDRPISLLPITTFGIIWCFQTWDKRSRLFKQLRQ